MARSEDLVLWADMVARFIMGTWTQGTHQCHPMRLRRPHTRGALVATSDPHRHRGRGGGRGHLCGCFGRLDP